MRIHEAGNDDPAFGIANFGAGRNSHVAASADGNDLPAVDDQRAIGDLGAGNGQDASMNKSDWLFVGNERWCASQHECNGKTA